jgi:hypothetical protein
MRGWGCSIINRNAPKTMLKTGAGNTLIFGKWR